MRYHIIEKEPCCASQQNWPAKLDPSIRGPLCPRKRTPLQRAIEPFPLPARPMNREPVPGVGLERRFGWASCIRQPASAALPLDHVAASRRYERSSNKRAKSRRFRVPALANSILGLIVLVLLFVF